MCPHKDLNVNGYASIRNHFNHVQLFVAPWTIACQAPLSMGFSRQEYWRGFPCPPPGIFPTQGWNPHLLTSPALAGGFFTTSTTWEEATEKAYEHYIIIPL